MKGGIEDFGKKKEGGGGVGGSGGRVTVKYDPPPLLDPPLYCLFRVLFSIS